MPGPAQPYVAGDEGGNARLLAYRLEFLRVVELIAPHVVEQLRAHVLPLYREAFNESPTFVRDQFFYGGCAGLARIPEALHGPRLPAFTEALREWATAHNLNEPWLLDAALAHLRVERTLGEPLTFGSAGGTVAYWQPAQTVAPPVYQPEHQTRAQHQEAVARYMDAVEAEYARAGWRPAAPLGEIEKHLLWLARHQVLGMTYEQVQSAAAADDTRDDDVPVPELSTVRRGILRASDAIDITLRSAPNRPR